VGKWTGEARLRPLHGAGCVGAQGRSGVTAWLGIGVFMSLRMGFSSLGAWEWPNAELVCVPRRSPVIFTCQPTPSPRTQ
jgi:hypothetical protein